MLCPQITCLCLLCLMLSNQVVNVGENILVPFIVVVHPMRPRSRLGFKLSPTLYRIPFQLLRIDENSIDQTRACIYQL